MSAWFDKSIMKGLLRASTVGIHLVISTFIGFAIGRFLDSFLHTDMWMTWVFLALGIAAGFRDLFRFARQSNDNKKDI